MAQVVDARAIVNGIVGLMATGGSTNHTLHLPAIARAAGFILEWEDFADISHATPLLARVYPNGAADVNRFHRSGGMAFIVRELIAAYQQMIARAHDHGLKIYGATILPDFGGPYYHPDAANEADRHAVNDWIRAPGHFDAIVDFDALVRDPVHPERMRPELDSGDHIHPSLAGYRAMAEAVPLALFARHR